MSNDLNSKINAVERDIASTANEIEETKNELKNPRDAAHGDFLMKRLLQLQDEKNKLRDEKAFLSKFLLASLCKSIFL